MIIGDRHKQILEVHDPDVHEAYAQDGGQKHVMTRTGPLLVDHDQHIAYLGTQSLRLTGIETAMLLCLARRVGRLSPRRHILTTVWGAEYFEEFHLLRVNMSRLRSKLGIHHPLIETRPGIGYILLQVPPP